MTKKLTEPTVRALAPERTRREIPDGGKTGLYLVVQPSGVKSWAVRYRLNGRPAKLTLGRYPGMGIAEARRKGEHALLKVARGEDPARDKRTQKSAGDSVAEIVDIFIERHAKPKNRSWRDTDRLLRKYVVPAWGKRRLGDIRRPEIHELLDRIVDVGAPISANRVLSAIRKMWNWAIERGYVETSPIQGIKPPSREVARDRVLTDQELLAIWNGAGQIGWPFGPIVQLLALTGQRRNEVAGARWSEFDLAAGLWSIPHDRRKGAVAHAVPLSELALDVLQTLPRFAHTDLLFPAQNGGNGFASGFGKAKSRLETISGVTGWRLHDLRRTVATGLQGLRVQLEVIEEVLGHRSGSRAGIVGVYQRHRFEKEKRAALESWAEKLRTMSVDQPRIVAA